MKHVKKTVKRKTSQYDWMDFMFAIWCMNWDYDM